MPETPAPPGLGHNARVAVFVNPAARGTHDRELIAEVASRLSARYRVDVVSPAGIAAIEQAARDAASTHDAVVVAGGDGTLHRVINALAGVATPLGLLPLGTGNDFARATGIPADADGAAAMLLAGRVRAIDLVEVNGRLFCTVGVIGVPAEATLAFDRLQRPGAWTRPLMRAMGGWAYRVAGLTALLRGGPLVEQVAVDMEGEGGTLRPVHGVFITNTRLLGGGLDLPVECDYADGQFEVACIEPMSRARLFWAFACFANGWRVPAGVLRVARGSRAVITSDRPVPFAADGELVCTDQKFELRVRPGALRVIC